MATRRVVYRCDHDYENNSHTPDDANASSVAAPRRATFKCGTWEEINDALPGQGPGEETRKRPCPTETGECLNDV